MLETVPGVMLTVVWPLGWQGIVSSSEMKTKKTVHTSCHGMPKRNFRQVGHSCSPRELSLAGTETLQLK